MHDLTATILRLNGLDRGHYAEPYAGGCGLALSLLYEGCVSDIHINDCDPAIWSFWHCILNDFGNFIERFESTPVTIEEWLKQRDIHRAQDISDPLSLGFSAFFLNRTNRSGIIKAAGVIGGLGQTGNYKLDCRYNRDDLNRRISRVQKYRDQIHLTRMDAIDFLNSCEQTLPNDSFYFIDPPYYHKGPGLYTSFYKPDDHQKVADVVKSLKRPWVVTYDYAEEIQSLYKERRQYCFDINYSLQEKRLGTELLIASKGLRLQEEFRARQVHAPGAKRAA